MKRIVSDILLLFGVMMPIMAKAARASVSISCPESAILSSTVECQVSVNSDVLVNGVVANYSLKGAAYVGFTPQSGFSQNYISESGFNVGNVSVWLPYVMIGAGIIEIPVFILGAVRNYIVYSKWKNKEYRAERVIYLSAHIYFTT